MNKILFVFLLCLTGLALVHCLSVKKLDKITNLQNKLSTVNSHNRDKRQVLLPVIDYPFIDPFFDPYDYYLYDYLYGYPGYAYPFYGGLYY